MESYPPRKLAVSVREAAGMLGVSPRTIQNYISAKLLFPIRKIGRRTVVPVRTLEVFLRADRALPKVKTPDRVTCGEP